MAARLCVEKPPPRTLGDDLESFALVLLWLIGRYAALCHLLSCAPCFSTGSTVYMVTPKLTCFILARRLCRHLNFLRRASDTCSKTCWTATNTDTRSWGSESSKNRANWRRTSTIKHGWKVTSGLWTYS